MKLLLPCVCAVCFCLIGACAEEKPSADAPARPNTVLDPVPRPDTDSGTESAAGRTGNGDNADTMPPGATATAGEGTDVPATPNSSTAGTGSTVGTDSGAAADDGALSAPELENDPPSSGATVTFENIGSVGSYPSRRDPASGACDAVDTEQCCMTQHAVTSDALTPWDDELIMQLRGPLLLERYAVYQPDAAAQDAPWLRSALWDRAAAAQPEGVVFGADGVEGDGFDGTVGSSCVLDVMAKDTVPCGDGSLPYCSGADKHAGWSGSKLFVLTAKMPHAQAAELATVEPCAGPEDNWYDAPWIGLSLGELVRSGKFGSCHCYAQNPDEWWLADGCGQFNAFEVVNDNNTFANLDLFSTNFFGYQGYIGEGPCGEGCDVSGLPASVDLVDKADSQAAAAGGRASPAGGPGVAFRRPAAGYRVFFILFDVASRQVQLGMLHPDAIPTALAPLLPGLPNAVPAPVVTALRELSLPQ